jgi:hypothetical protein
MKARIKPEFRHHRFDERVILRSQPIKARCRDIFVAVFHLVNIVISRSKPKISDLISAFAGVHPFFLLRLLLGKFSHFCLAFRLPIQACL